MIPFEPILKSSGTAFQGEEIRMPYFLAPNTYHEDVYVVVSKHVAIFDRREDLGGKILIGPISQVYKEFLIGLFT